MNSVKMIPVQSSNLQAVGYDVSEKRLYVRFLNGSEYVYFNVPENIYQGLMQAASHGQFLDRFVKKAGYTYERII